MQVLKPFATRFLLLFDSLYKILEDPQYPLIVSKIQ